MGIASIRTVDHGAAILEKCGRLHCSIFRIKITAVT